MPGKRQTKNASESWYDWLFASGRSNQVGGGRCTLCLSPGTTRATCPLNPKAKNPNPVKHPKAAGKAPASPSEIVPRHPVGSRGCTYQDASKYHAKTRKSPPFPANECCGEIMEGNDGQLWESRQTKAGSCRWVKVSK